MRFVKLRSSATLAAVLVSMAAFGAGCGVSGEKDGGKDATAEVVNEKDGGAPSSSATTAAGAPAGSIDVAGAELPRTVTYTGLEVTVNAAKAATDVVKGPGVALTLAVHSTLKVEWKISPLAVGLVDGDGVRLRASGFDDPNDPESGFAATGDVPVISEGKIERTAFIPVEGGLDLAKAKLSVAEEGMLPAEVPLAGKVPERPFPVPVTVSTEPGTVGGVLGDPLTLTLQSAELTDESNGWRADEGAHLVVVKYRAVGSGRGATITQGTMRLVVDGAPNDAVTMVGPEVAGVGGGEGKDFIAIYSLPDDHEEVSMLGTSDRAFGNQPPDHPFAITVPPLPGS